MKTRIFDRFTENNKWHDYLNFKSFEIKMSLITVLAILVLFYTLNIYDNFNAFLLPLQNLTLYIFQALIGMLGIILAGLAIIVGLLNKETIHSIEKHNDKLSLQKTLISFEFLSFNIGIGIFIFVIIHLILYSKQSLINTILFYFILAIVTYFLAFIMFYTISLIGNCIRVFYINNIYNDIATKEKNIYEAANEVRIDYLLYALQKQTHVSPNELLDDLDKFVDATNSKDKEEIKKYLRSYYS